ncbi:BON domain-containing protein [Elongatibacter sediminis]|uniref:BON domain-containing protein n=1 Tax=Elongatibacter sediminis TaxID=3119006 RepID=A0AAW9R7R3_9GAMM
MNKRIRTPILSSRKPIAAAAAMMLVISPAFAGGDKAGDGKSEMKSESRQMSQVAEDAWLDGKLESALLFNEHLNSFDIDTEVRHGTAYLKGAVESEIDRELAGEVAKSVAGIQEVENELSVDRKAAEAAADSDSYQEKSEWRQAVANATLTATVKSRLLINEHTSGLDINVDSSNGVVTLSGTVDSEEEAELAAQIADNVSDTRDVNNRLEVSETQQS